MKKSPPRFFLKFFRWFCHPEMQDYIEGDLMEVYEARLRTLGKRKADFRFIIDVLLLFRPGIIKPVEGSRNLNTYGMYKNYLIIGWRNLIKDKMFSIINVSGLSLGLTCSMLIALWVIDEYNMDGFHKDSERIFIVTSCEYSGSEINGGYDTPGLLGDEIKKVIPEIELSCSYGWISWYTFAVEEKRIKMGGSFAGADFFKIFSYPLLLGSRETALVSPDAIAISRKMAISLFGSPELAMDKSIRFENYLDLRVAAVFEDLGDNVSEKFDYLINWELFLKRNEWSKDWHNSGLTTFIKLREHVGAEEVSLKIRHFIKGYDKEYGDLDRLELGLQPFSEKYLYSNFKNGYVAGGRIEYVQLFKVVAVFILLIACINFMNLSTARSVKRAREIGVRKVNGAMKASLISQFMLESFLFTAMAVLFSVLLLMVLLPQFNLLTGKNLASPVSDGKFWMGVLALMGMTALISGSYPAIMLSSFKPIAVLKGSFKNDSSSVFFRKGLVIFQFGLSMIFIVGMMVISRQVSFIQNKNIGYQKNNLIYMPLTGNMAAHYNTFRNEAMKIPGIVQIGSASNRFVELDNTTGSVEWEGKAPNTKPNFVQDAVGYHFIDVMRATLVLGRDFSEEYADSSSYILNEAAVRVMGFKDPIGMQFTFWHKKGTIIGVVKDFHFNSLHVPIKPLILRLRRGSGYANALVRVEPEKTASALTDLEALHKKLNPDFPFNYQFVDDEYRLLYQSEQVVKKLSTYFAFLAIFISCLGLLGLVMFTAEQRTKEIGVRKVLGANVTQIVALMSMDFLILVIASIVIATPVAWFMMNEWLSGFEYHVDLPWWVFVAASAGSMSIALVTISFQAIKAAMVNPVKSLRSE